jgi:hypothetical protein
MKKTTYFGIKEKPKDGQLCLCRCPDWCHEGYQVANFEDDKFSYDSDPNGTFNNYVIAWLPLNEDGLPL